MASTLAGLESSVFSPAGTSKTLVYAAPVDSEEALHHRIVDACQTIHNCPSISEWIRRSMLRRVKACIESHGGHSEHLWSSGQSSWLQIQRSQVRFPALPDFLRSNGSGTGYIDLQKLTFLFLKPVKSCLCSGSESV
jgi:hypothetical protein